MCHIDCLICTIFARRRRTEHARVLVGESFEEGVDSRGVERDGEAPLRDRHLSSERECARERARERVDSLSDRL